MTPERFLSTYGQAQARTVSIPAVTTVEIPADIGRYLLVFWRTSGQLNIAPQGVDVTLFGFANFSETSLPIFITHALYGALANIRWTIRNDGGMARDLVIIEAFMRGNGDPIDKLKPVKRKRRTKRSTTTNIPPAAMLPTTPGDRVYVGRVPSAEVLKWAAEQQLSLLYDNDSGAYYYQRG